MSKAQAMKFLKSRGYNPTNPMTPYITEWRGWVNADNSFYKYIETTDERKYEATRNSLKPASWVCGTWASLLFNEATEIVAEDDLTNEWLHEYLESASFLAKGQSLVQTAFALGTSAWSLRISNINENELRSENARVFIQRHDADDILPLTYNEDECTECAFLSTTVIRGRALTQLTIHEKMPEGYVITALHFDTKGLVDTEYSGVINTLSQQPLFGLIKPALNNPYFKTTPLGVSVFDDAVDALKLTDLAFDNMYKDIYLGQSMVFISDTLIPLVNGKPTINRFRDQQIFRKVTGDQGSASTNIETFQPDLRVADNTAALAEALERLGQKVGFGKGFLNANRSMKTATEIVSENADLYNHIKTHQNELHKPLMALGNALVWFASQVKGLPEADVDVRFADAIVTDANTQRAQDLSDVGAGLMARWQYIAKWQGLDDTAAQTLASEIMPDAIA